MIRTTLLHPTGNNAVRATAGFTLFLVLALSFVCMPEASAQVQVTSSVPLAVEAALGRELSLFPFDTVRQFPQWFADTEPVVQHHDSTRYNGSYSNKEKIEAEINEDPCESVYRPEHGRTIIAENIPLRSVASLPVAGSVMQRDSVMYVVVRGHLFAGGTATNDTPLFRVTVYDGERVVKTTDFTKRDFLPPSSPDYDVYREATMPVRLNGKNIEHTVRVDYLGGEAVALRSVILRNHPGQMLRSSEPEAIAYRTALLEEIGRLSNDWNLPRVLTTLYGHGVLSLVDPYLYRRYSRFLYEDYGVDTGTGNE